MKNSKLNLKQAREQGKLDQFVKEHEKDSDGDEDRLNATLKSALDPVPQKKKPAQKKK